MKLALYILLLMTLWCAEARAQQPEDPEGVALKQRGNAAMLNLAYADAAGFYEKAYALRPSDTSLLYNLGRAHQLLGDFPRALDELEKFGSTAPPDVRAQVKGLDKVLAEVRAHVSTLDLRATVTGARVLVRDKVVGTTPMERLRVTAGSAVVVVEQDGYFPYRRTLDLPAGQVTVIEATLAPRATSGLVRLQSAPVGASVAVDGSASGNTPIELPLVAGSHAIAMSREGYETSSVRVFVEAGKTNDFPVVELTRETRIYERWWFWTSIGVVIAGGVVITYAVLHERKADTGDLPPGQIAAPLVRF